MTNVITGDGRSFSSRTNTGEDEVHQHHEQQRLHHHILDTVSAAGANGGFSTSQLLLPPIKKKRNLPGTPDPTAEVIALSPKTLMATNRFVCEICHKGFQREQNLQLHRRCHNLPWKLRPRTSTESRKRVYVCPELTCVHHNPSRALGDLTGIKKHYCRKHGEKKWNCNKCSKKYAVQSDWKAHSKICGTREYKCDCGTIFSRRESFITHRVFCGALVQEDKLNQPLVAIMASNLMMPINTNASSMELSNLSHDDMKSPPFRTYSNNLSLESFRPPGVAETLYNPRTIPSSSFQLSGCGPMGFHELGATAGKNSITSVMAGPYRAYGSRPYIPMKAHGLFGHIRSQGKQPQLVGINGGIADQFYDPSANHIGLFTTVGTSMSGGDGVVTTVDFLGVGGERSLHWQKQQEAMEYGGIGHGPSLEVFHSFKN